jgi:ribokinase
MHGYDLLVVGSANADLVIGVDRRPAAGETVLGSDLVTHPGGKGANQAVAAARLGASVCLLGRVGDDSHGRLLLESQRTAGVGTDAMLIGGAPTGVALIVVGPEGDNSIVVSPGANALLSPQDVHAAGELLSTARVVSLQLEIPLDTVAAAVRAAGPQTRVVLNPSPPAPLPPEVLASCDPLVLNEHEARAMLAGDGHDTPEQWCDALLAMGPRSVVVTLGADGVIAADATGIVRVPGLAVRVVDTTGAGDAFTGALAWRLGAGDTLAEAVRFAVRVGAAAVTKTGAQGSFPTLEEVTDL